jgi:hypothetical protein
MIAFLLVYLFVTGAGLAISLLEWRHARCVYRDLVLAKTNGARQTLARFYVKEEGLRVLVLLCLMCSVISVRWWAAGQALKLIAVVLIAVKAWVCRVDRITIMNLLHAKYAEPTWDGVERRREKLEKCE